MTATRTRRKAPGATIATVPEAVLVRRYDSIGAMLDARFAGRPAPAPAREVTIPSGIYPCHLFGPSRYAETMRVISVLTGTASSLEDPTQWPAHELEGAGPMDLGDLPPALESAYQRFEAAHAIDRMNDTTAMDMRGYFEGPDL
jgi:hypothetical protein